VVNSQYDLIEAVQEKLKGKSYFKTERYYEKMRKIWEAPPDKPTWSTLITKVEPNRLTVQGYILEDLVRKVPLLAVTHLLVHGRLPKVEELGELNAQAVKAASLDMEKIPVYEGEDLSKSLAKYLLMDKEIALFRAASKKSGVERTIFCLGRMARYLATHYGNEQLLNRKASPDEPFQNIIYRAMSGDEEANPKRTRMLEAMIVASVDHGATPPSAQGTLISASTRGAYELAVAHGVGNITDVHGGAGAKAAVFFRECVRRSEEEGIGIKEATQALIEELMHQGKRIEGMGHRIHTRDPRRDVLWTLAEETGVAGPCVAISKVVSGIFERVRGMRLPINVDGVIGAIVADMGLPAPLAKAIFIFGRVAGLSAHYFEEVASQPQMRRINFALAEYRGPENRTIPATY
jgi:citrate synthase